MADGSGEGGSGLVESLVASIRPELDVDQAKVWSNSAGESFTGMELSVALKVLRIAASEHDIRADKSLRSLKAAAERLNERPRDKQRHSESLRRQRQKEDERHFNNAKLRQARLDTLNKLVEPALGAPMLMAPPDPLQDTATDCTENIREDGETLNYSKACYVCKVKYFQVHEFYFLMCPACAALNYEKRNQMADLKGRYAIVTGGRVKIGFNVAIKLLRCGATVIVTTRFPRDAARRFAAESDFNDFASRLQVFALDMRDLQAVQQFATHVKSITPFLDIIINNAAQTIRRPPDYYRHMLGLETAPLSAIEPAVASVVKEVVNAQVSFPVADMDVALATTTESAAAAVFPLGKFDEYEQQLDLRKQNSWTLKLHEVSTAEAVEVHAINALAPFVLNSQLKDHMLQSSFVDRYIVNVSAMEGKFYRYKSADHPHTNMAKAALNMMTRTSAGDYAKSGIFMTAVDTGWINDENPLEKAVKYAINNQFHCPIDETDAAARILDPVLHGVNTGERLFGVFLKDYRETEW